MVSREFLSFRDSRMFKQAAQQAAGEEKPEVYPLRYVEDFSDPRTPLDACFNILPLHVPIFALQLHPTPFILRTARSLRHRSVPQLNNDVVHRLGARLDRRRAGRTAETAIAGPITLVEIEIHEGNVLELDVFPNIDLRPIQQRVDSDVCAR